MLVAPSIFPTYFSHGDTAASNTSSNIAIAPATPADSKDTFSALNDTPSYTANDVPVSPPKDTQVPRALLLESSGPNVISSPNAAPISNPVVAPSSPTESKPAQSFNSPTDSHVEHAHPTARKFDLPHRSVRAPRAGIPPRHARRASAFRTQGANTFISVNQGMAVIEERFTKRILQLESERNEQQNTIQFLTEELERLIASLNSSPGAPIPIPVYDPIQAPPPPGALRPLLPPTGERSFFQHLPRGCSAPTPQNLCFWAPLTAPVSTPLPPSAVPPAFRGHQPYPPPAPVDQHNHSPPHQTSNSHPYSPPPAPADAHYYSPPQQTSYTRPYSSPPAPAEQRYYPSQPQASYPPPPGPPQAPSQHAQYAPSVQYPSIASGYNSFSSETTYHHSESCDVSGNGYEGVEVMAY